MREEGDPMVYWKLDDQTIRCLINKEEIRKMGFDLNEISRDAELMADFLSAIVDDSRNYIDWNTENGVQNYIARALPADQFLITISCTFPDKSMDQDIEKFLRFMELLNKVASGEEHEKESPEQEMSPPPKKEKTRRDKGEKKRTADCLPAQRLTFSGMDELMTFSALLDERYFYSSELYRLHDDYILLVEFEPSDDKTDIIRFMITAEEYGAQCRTAENSAYYLREHGRLLIPEDALSVLESMTH